MSANRNVRQPRYPSSDRCREIRFSPPISAILNRAPVPLSRVNPELPAEFELILAKAVEKDPELRCQSAAELRADLKRLKREAESDRTHLSDLYLVDGLK